MNILIERFIEILLVPYNYTEVLWIVVPLVLAMIFITVYFGRYRYEELGWNSAFGNSLILLFISMDLIRRLYMEGVLGFLDFRNLLTLGVIFEAVVLLMISFFHLLPKKVAYDLYQNVPINVIAYSAVILVYSDIIIDFITIIDTIILVIVLAFMLNLVKKLVPKAVELLPWEVEEYKKAPEPE